MITTYPQIVERMSEAEYHADPCDRPSLSSSIAGIIVNQSAAHAQLAHPRFYGSPPNPTAAMDDGKAAHAMLLQEGGDIATVFADDWRTKAARVERDKAYADGRTPILFAQYKRLHAAVGTIRYKLKKRGVHLRGEKELSLFWEHSEPGKTITCRSRLDHFDQRDGCVDDLKFVANAHPKKCRQKIIDFGYHIQRAAYLEGLHANGIDAYRMPYRLHFCELTAPYCVTTVTLRESMAELGERCWGEACNTWEHATRTDEWPEYWAGEYGASAKPWELRGEIDDE